MTDKICDCNQGRLPCSCKGLTVGEMIEKGWLTESERAGFLRQLEQAKSQGAVRLEELSPLLASREAGTYAVNVAMRRGKQIHDQLMHIDALNVRLKIYQGVAIIGWVAAILLALGV